MSRFALSLAVLTVVTVGSVSAQFYGSVTDAAPAVTADSAIDAAGDRSTLVITSDPRYWDVGLVKGHPSSLAIFFMSHSQGPWYLDFGYKIGAVDLEVYQPIDLLMGVTDSLGSLDVRVPKPSSVPPAVEGHLYYAQVVSVEITPDPNGDPGVMSFGFRLSNVSSFVLSAY